MEKNFSEKIEIVRNSFIDQLTHFEEPSELLGFASCSYIAFQTICVEMQKPEDERMDIKLIERINRINFCLSASLDDLAEDFKDFISSEGEKDFLFNFAYPIVRHYVAIQNEEAKDGDPVIDLSDNAVFDYALASFCTLLRIAYNPLSANEIIDYIRYDKVDDFSISATDPCQSYEWVRNEFDIVSSDLAAFNKKVAEMEPLDEAEKQDALGIIDDMKALAKSVLPKLAFTSLIPNASEDEKEQVSVRMNEMLADEHHADRLCTFFIQGLTFLPFIPKFFDLKQTLATSDDRDDLFEAFYKCFAGSDTKDYYEALDNVEKTIARIAWLGGLSFASTSGDFREEDDDDSTFTITQGAAFAV